MRLLVALVLLGLPAYAAPTIERITLHEGGNAVSGDKVHSQEIVVATAWYPLYYLGERLARDTSIRVIDGGYIRYGTVNSYPVDVENFGGWFEHLICPETVRAVLTLRTINPDDTTAQLFAPAGVEEIDVTAATVDGRSGIAVLGDENGSPRWRWFWLSLPNLTRLAEVIADSFSRLSPNDAPSIETSLATLRQELQDLNQYVSRETSQLRTTDVQLAYPQAEYLLQSLGLNIVAHSVGELDYSLQAPIVYTPDNDASYLMQSDKPPKRIRIDTLLDRPQKFTSRDPNLLGRFRKNLEILFAALNAPEEAAVQ